MVIEGQHHRRRHFAMRAVGAFVMTIAAASCVDVLGITSLREDPCHAPEHVEAGCVECMRDACCSPMAACADDAACSAANACIAGCEVNDPVCRHACFEQHEQAMASAVFGEVDGCRRGSCVSECLGPGGWEEFLPESAECTECVASCDELGLECVAVAECEHVAGCIGSCSDPSCLYGCYDSFSRVDVPEYRSCLRGCSEKCGIDNDFTCAGSYSWFAEQNDDVEFELPLFELYGGAPLEEASVRFCTTLDCPTCLEQTGPGAVTTGTNGVWTVPVPYEQEGCFAIKSPGLVPTLFYPGRPITNGNGLATYGILPADALVEFAASIGLTHTQGKGGFYVRQIDCEFSAGVRVEFETSNRDENTSEFAYSPDGANYSVGAKGDQAIIANHPVGTTTVTAKIGSDEDGFLEIASTVVFVPPDVATIVYLFPRAIE